MFYRLRNWFIILCTTNEHKLSNYLLPIYCKIDDMDIKVKKILSRIQILYTREKWWRSPSGCDAQTDSKYILYQRGNSRCGLCLFRYWGPFLAVWGFYCNCPPPGLRIFSLSSLQVEFCVSDQETSISWGEDNKGFVKGLYLCVSSCFCWHARHTCIK